MTHHEQNTKKTCQNGMCNLCCTKIENFGVSYGRDVILKDVNLHIHCGELTAIIGPNGGGKSTLLKAILGVVKHTGEMKFVKAQGKQGVQPVIGYVPQKLDFDPGMPTSVMDLFQASQSRIPVWLARSGAVKEQSERSLSAVNAGHLLNKKLGNLSGGELQRVLLALALNPVPDILLLDEPVSGVDLSGLELFYNIVSEVRKNYDLSILLVSHDLPLVAEYADRVVFINGTVIANGNPKEVYGSEQFIKTFGSVPA